jgi:septal ring factor EnvC (AmiA/AmiB activator)
MANPDAQQFCFDTLPPASYPQEHVQFDANQQFVVNQYLQPQLGYATGETLSHLQSSFQTRAYEVRGIESRIQKLESQLSSLIERIGRVEQFINAVCQKEREKRAQAATRDATVKNEDQSKASPIFHDNSNKLSNQHI